MAAAWQRQARRVAELATAACCASGAAARSASAQLSNRRQGHCRREQLKPVLRLEMLLLLPLQQAHHSPQTQVQKHGRQQHVGAQRKQQEQW